MYDPRKHDRSQGADQPHQRARERAGAAIEPGGILVEIGLDKHRVRGEQKLKRGKRKRQWDHLAQQAAPVKRKRWSKPKRSRLPKDNGHRDREPQQHSGHYSGGVAPQYQHRHHRHG